MTLPNNNYDGYHRTLFRITCVRCETNRSVLGQATQYVPWQIHLLPNIDIIIDLQPRCGSVKSRKQETVADPGEDQKHLGQTPQRMDAATCC